MNNLSPWKINELPKPLGLRKMIGPSLILLGLGLGSGEIILWPYLTANFGLGIAWAVLVGLTFQFFLNMEVERYALVRGESVFVGFARLFRYLPLWFILSTFIGFGWPGIIASSAKIFSEVAGIERFDYLAIALLIAIGLILSLGPVLYKTVETYQKISISIGIPVVVILTLLIAKSIDWQNFASGLIGRGEGYWFIPRGIPLFTFLGALAYAGAGGNLNLTQSFYIKEKGYGMGKYSGRISSLLTGKKEKTELTGSTFEVTPESLGMFRKWWRLVNLEHGIVFWGLGIFTVSMLIILAYATTLGQSGNDTGINFIITEGKIISNELLPIAGTIFLLIAGLMLFGTQLTVMDSTSRIISENIVLSSRKETIIQKIPKIYYSVLWTQIAFGIIVFLSGFSEPKTLLVTGAVFNALAMFVSFALILTLNSKLLPLELRPIWWRKLILYIAFAFFGFFATYAFLNAFGIVK